MKTNGKGFLICPGCGRPTKTKVLPGTTLTRFPLYCGFCRREVVVDHVEGKKPQG